MSNANSPVETQQRDDPLVVVADRLRQALAQDPRGRERDWGRAITELLAHVETAVWQHRLNAKAQDGLFAEVDEARPAMAKQVDKLRTECDGFLMQATALREEAQCIAESVPQESEPSAENLAAIRELAEQFLDSVEKNREAETRLVLESVNSDIGVGD